MNFFQQGLRQILSGQNKPDWFRQEHRSVLILLQYQFAGLDFALASRSSAVHRVSCAAGSPSEHSRGLSPQSRTRTLWKPALQPCARNSASKHPWKFPSFLQYARWAVLWMTNGQQYLRFTLSSRRPFPSKEFKKSEEVDDCTQYLMVECVTTAYWSVWWMRCKTYSCLFRRVYCDLWVQKIGSRLRQLQLNLN